MSKVCEICGKSPTTGNMVSHSNKKAKRWWKPNVHNVRAMVNGEVKRVKICSKCLKAGKIQRAV
ncbi:MAG TPA: 50S ribosomal protein L28 [Mesotoga sp.]|jgi:large subunit ribosomal protein L28|nr:50S ribosomal protein L28 [Mesotoga sp.]NLX33584.1 50S ribosomal protein L28 [Thermotogaceae bacterium]MDD4039625.1 50S ribosomal protein L28 [Mesotoga sp.]MDD4477793.1 50S ribosomal protein L28 [Mesotoga sp.]MDD5743710.1 50S ribosomal protein L28 [Mesotoga sp.]